MLALESRDVDSECPLTSRKPGRASISLIKLNSLIRSCSTLEFIVDKSKLDVCNDVFSALLQCNHLRHYQSEKSPQVDFLSGKCENMNYGASGWKVSQSISQPMFYGLDDLLYENT